MAELDSIQKQGNRVIPRRQRGRYSGATPLLVRYYSAVVPTLIEAE